ncbi:MAG: DNA polymerase III subunit delta, partial [Myxococcales bacterium]|nr:DNA polymerase III subunit delta [Myxococcales bacterium]
TMPMMASRRLVVVGHLERWDAKSAGQGDHPLDRLADYAADPPPTTVMILTASKLNGSRRLVKQAKKEDFVVRCEALDRRELPGFVQRTARDKGHALEPGVADNLAELLGPDLAPVADALERLSLYVGPGGTISEEAVSAVVTRVRQETVWQLVDALAARDLGGALAAMHDAYDPRDRGLPMLGAVAWRVRQLLKFHTARRQGKSSKDAAKIAGVAPFKAGELERTRERLSTQALEDWLMLLGEADLALKGSKRSGDAVLATMMVDMCRPRAGRPRPRSGG